MRKAKIFIIYFPIILVSCQILLNIFGTVWYDTYIRIGFYFNLMFGTNILFATFLLIFTYLYKFCSISRYSAIAEMLFAINYAVVQSDSLYNITFQITVGVLALILTFKAYIKKFPMCTMSLVHKFFESILITGSCAKAVERFDMEIRFETEKKIRNDRQLRKPSIAYSNNRL